MNEIVLSNGMVTLIDDEDYDLVSSFRWNPRKDLNTYYAECHIPSDTTRDGRTSLLLHRLIMGEPEGLQVDHEDGNGLNNQRSNLRIASPTQNQGNARRRKDNTSGYKGVSWYRRTNKWKAHIRVDKKLRHLGYFIDLTDAARAYDAAALEHFGEFAHLNFPGGD
jgi:hypothetical protein